ncbi:MAG: bifunctional glutamate N-acetyltransferase/amino-acid acetyltransferase ArgJ [Bryobacteraceae bacterium]
MILPLGYRYSSVFAGIRKVEQDDLGLIVSGRPASAAGVFTQNRVQAAPVKLARANLTAGTAQAILVNAGNANCATVTADAVALQSCEALSKRLNIAANQVLPASTGVIGVELDAALITGKLDALVSGLSADSFEAVARAMMTTDQTVKMAFEQVGEVRIAGMTKGAGMIHPNMATTLGFILTDAELTVPSLRRMLAAGVTHSYNRISVDSDTSTNDTLLLLANGASGVKEDAGIQDAVGRVMDSLAEQIVRDGEGARKLITIRVMGAVSEQAAERIARAIANSPLVKTAIAGSDPNWGRILSAAGNSGVNLNPAKVNISIQDVLVCKNGVAAEFSEQTLKQKLDSTDCLIRFEIQGRRRAAVRFWTCDFTEKYIEINASYRT